MLYFLAAARAINKKILVSPLAYSLSITLPILSSFTHLPHPKVSQLIRARMIINRGAIIVLMFELSQNLGRERFRGKRDYCVS